MILIYEKETGKIVSNTGTNSNYPDNSHIDLESLNFSQEEYGFLKLNDIADAEIVQAYFDLVTEFGTNIYIKFNDNSFDSFIAAPIFNSEITSIAEKYCIGDVITIETSLLKDWDKPITITYEEEGIFKAEEIIENAKSTLEFSTEIEGEHTIKVSSSEGGMCFIIFNVERSED